MPFSVTDILQPLDSDGSTSYKRSHDITHGLTTASSSSSSSSSSTTTATNPGSYNLSRPSTSATPAGLCNPTFIPSSVHSNYYHGNGSSTATFSPNHQYYDYSSALPTGGTVNSINSQYSPSSCWYGSAASMFIVRCHRSNNPWDTFNV
jgi:hypothetical protein